MPIIIDSFDQNSVEWFQACLGNPGASNASKIITTKGEPSKQATEYMYQLAGELIAGKPEEGFKSFNMEKGSEREAEARSVFSMEHETEVRQVALVYKDEKRMFHCSPDGLIGDNSGLEIKCPMLKTHVGHLLAGKLPTDYFGQVQMSLYVTEREYWTFCSYYPDLPLFTIRVDRDEKYIDSLSGELYQFCYKLAALVEKLRGM